MSPIRDQLVGVIAKRFISDDVATEQDIIDIEKARAEYERGETIPHSAINWD